MIGDKGYLRATIGPEAQAMPFFIHGTTTEGEFQQQLDRRETPYVELVSGHAFITTSLEAARRFRGEDHNVLLNTYEEILNIEDRVSGFDESSATHARLDHRYHLITREELDPAAAAYATEGHMIFPKPIQDRVLTVDGLRLRGWGIYHELGHQHQQQAYRPQPWQEVTVNWYSLAVNQEFSKRFGQFPRLHSPESDTGESVWTSAPPKIGSPGVDISTTFTQVEQLVLFEQLRLGLGDEGKNVLPRIHKLVREEKPDNGSVNDLEHRFSNFVHYASKAAGYDLRTFTQAWGVHHSAEIDARITALNLPQPPIDFTQVRDEDGANLAAPVLRRLQGRRPDLGL